MMKDIENSHIKFQFHHILVSVVRDSDQYLHNRMHIARSLARALLNSSLRSSVSLKSISISVNLPSVRTMSDDSKAKSDDEWRAILSPEQVCSSHQNIRSALLQRICTVQSTPFEGYRTSWDGRVREE